jgi:hypothetical protein
MTDNKEVALWYARRKWPIFPCWWVTGEGGCGCGDEGCKDAGKHPISEFAPQGFKNATTAEGKVGWWWTKYPNANIATPACLRIDVDNKRGGMQAWEDILAENGGEIDTVIAETGSGGLHYYFRPHPQVNSNRTGSLPDDIDVRGHMTGYTLLPPSNHVKGEYVWIESPAEAEIAELPQFLVDLLMVDSVEFNRGVSKPAELEKFDLSGLAVAVIIGDRSRIDQGIITALIRAGATDDEIFDVFEQYDVSGKFAEKGNQGGKYLSYSIGKAREYWAKRESSNVSIPRRAKRKIVS